MAALSDLLSDNFDWTLMSNWVPVYEAIERRKWVVANTSTTKPPAVSNPTVLDLRQQSEGYDLQKIRSVPAGGGGTVWRTWLYAIQDAVAGPGGAYAGPPTPSASVAGWLDPDNPLSAGKFNPLDATAKLGLGGTWRRKRPREIAATNATTDRFGNAAAAGQRAYLYTGDIFFISGSSQVYRCVAPGNWVRDDSQSPDTLDSSAGTLPWGAFQPGDYMGRHIFWEICRRLQLMTTFAIQPGPTTGRVTIGGDYADGTGGSPSSGDPRNSAGAAAADAAGSYSVATGTSAFSTGAALWIAYGTSQTATFDNHTPANPADDYTGYYISLSRSYQSGAWTYWGEDTGTFQGVLFEQNTNPVVGATWVFDPQGITGLTAGGIAKVGAPVAFTTHDASGNIFFNLANTVNANVAPDYPAFVGPPSPYTAKGFNARLGGYVVWNFPES